MTHSDDEIEEYGETGIYSADAKIPGWLKLTYLILPIWGIIWFFFSWNGAAGWMDRGHWSELEKAANTQFPNVNYNDNDTQR